mmetsp:Transcript_8256/g.22967  ORF Transcript_8256/g.22967 Transcript_8256/m.22967 type:complete len:338 (+) Transcript_8256:272-1285(+)
MAPCPWQAHPQEQILRARDGLLHPGQCGNHRLGHRQRAAGQGQERAGQTGARLPLHLHPGTRPAPLRPGPADLGPFLDLFRLRARRVRRGCDLGPGAPLQGWDGGAHRRGPAAHPGPPHAEAAAPSAGGTPRGRLLKHVEARVRTDAVLQHDGLGLGPHVRHHLHVCLLWRRVHHQGLQGGPGGGCPDRGEVCNTPKGDHHPLPVRFHGFHLGHLRAIGLPQPLVCALLCAVVGHRLHCTDEPDHRAAGGGCHQQRSHGRGDGGHLRQAKDQAADAGVPETLPQFGLLAGRLRPNQGGGRGDGERCGHSAGAAGNRQPHSHRGPLQRPGHGRFRRAL